MALGKAPGPDGVITEFLKLYWDIIKEEYLFMITEVVQGKRLPKGVTSGIISLLF